MSDSSATADRPAFGAPETSTGRLVSLDVLRGLDMILLVWGGWLVNGWNKCWPLGKDVMRQFGHSWGVFTLWDIIMPLFIFMCGAAIPLALPRRMANGRPTAAYWRHVFGRVALLWLLGMIRQGNLLSYDPLRIAPFSNTLQAIAAGYLIAAAVLCLRNRWLRMAMPVLLAVVYTALLHAFGDYTVDGNFAQICERRILAWILPAGSKALETHGYSWFLTSLMFGVMTLTGMQTTEVLRGGLPPWRRVLVLIVAGALLLVTGVVLSPVIPPIKHIYTLTFVLESMGICVLLLAALYALIDVLKLRRGLWLFVLYGQFALWAYMAGYFWEPICAFVKIFTRGLVQFVGDRPMTFINAVGYVICVTVILWLRRAFKKKV